ncbi:hypothetical protein [Kingella potus]|uniref:hypothetical protein n=1 Tax=Kingella potus TaxID=265175 RepID=UPI001FD07F2D|nr:hypothetical protein [Kingella potus]UOP00975.1 hypothetical protein LVJ84_00755 [Kingella potus]
MCKPFGRLPFRHHAAHADGKQHKGRLKTVTQVFRRPLPFIVLVGSTRGVAENACAAVGSTPYTTAGIRLQMVFRYVKAV